MGATASVVFSIGVDFGDREHEHAGAPEKERLVRGQYIVLRPGRLVLVFTS
jgi:hypothetical protein